MAHQESFAPDHYTSVQGPEKDPKKNATDRAVHVLRDWLRAFGLPSRVGTDPAEVVVGVGAKASFFTVRVTSANGSFHASVGGMGDLLSYRGDTQLEAVYRVTEACGAGRPEPIDRGEKRAHVTYHDDYESVYLRTSALQRCPDPDPALYEKLLPLVTRSARKAHYQFRTIWDNNAVGVEDLVSFGRIHLVTFCHSYAYGTDEECAKRLHAYLKQRFGEWAKITRKKAANSTTLNEQRYHSNHTTPGSDTEFFDLMAHVPDTTIIPADQDYEDGEYKLIDQDGDEHSLLVRTNGLARIEMTVDDRVLRPMELDRLRDEVRLGRLRLVPVVHVEPVDIVHAVSFRQDSFGRSMITINGSEMDLYSIYLMQRGMLEDGAGPAEVAQRIVRARRLLQDKFAGLSREDLRDLLCSMAINPHLDPDVRREARKRCADEGFDIEAFRKMNESEIAPSKVRCFDADGNLKWEKNMEAQETSNTPTLTAEEVKKAKDTLRAERRAKEVQVHDKVDEYRTACIAKLPKEGLRCPSPNHSEAKSGRANGDLVLDDFGVRVTRDKETRLPIRANRQSCCIVCRRKVA